MKAVGTLLSFALACITLQAQSIGLDKNAKPGPPRLVVVGDSLSAGVQNFSLLDTQQPHGFASVVAAQAGWPLTLPLVPYPGSPNVLVFDPNTLQIVPAPGTLPNPPRDNPGEQPTNIAIPGLTVGSALTSRPSWAALKPGANPEELWATIVLGFPNLYRNQAPTEIEQAVELKPDLLIEWLGNNDALVPALFGQINTLTPVAQFAASYEQVLDKLSKTHAKLVTATIPDVTEIAYFTSPQTIANQTGAPLTYIMRALEIGSNDYVRPTAQAFIPGILANPATGPLPTYCPSPLPSFLSSPLPCILRDADARTVRAAINCYNLIITTETLLHGGVVVDIHELVDQIYKSGYKLRSGEILTTDFFGGLFSLDGIHPTDAGYAVIANEFITTMNAGLHTNIPPASVDSIFKADPLMPLANPHYTFRSSPPGSGTFCLTSN